VTSDPTCRSFYSLVAPLLLACVLNRVCGHLSPAGAGVSAVQINRRHVAMLAPKGRPAAAAAAAAARRCRPSRLPPPTPLLTRLPPTRLLALPRLDKRLATMAAPTTTTTLSLPAADDLHVHLRTGSMMRMVVPQTVAGGCRRVYVMVRLLGRKGDWIRVDPCSRMTTLRLSPTRRSPT